LQGGGKGLKKVLAVVILCSLFVLSIATSNLYFFSASALPEKQPKWAYQSVGTVNVVEVSPNGAYILMGTSDGYAYLFDSNSDVPLDAASIGGATDIMGVSYHGKYVAVSSENTFKVYEITSNILQFVFSFVNDPVYDWGGIHSLAFSSDGGLLVVGTWGYDLELSRRSIKQRQPI
jgi:WD40 repeat protein